MSLNNTKEKEKVKKKQFFFGKKQTEESKVNLSLSSINDITVSIKDLDTGIIKLFNSNV